jgi:small subunit ribosomal protein S24e
MEVEVINKKENKLFGRKEVLAKVSFSGSTPKRAELKTEVANKIVANPENCVLRNVTNEFGVRTVGVTLHAYESKEVMLKNEPRYILVREGVMPKPEKKKKEKKSAAKK